MAEKKQKKQPVESGNEGKENGKNFRDLVKTLGVSIRGRIFQGKVIRKFPKRVTIEFERTIKIPKYERFMKKRTRVHARLPDQFAEEVNLGDLIKVQECRPLSKIIHFMVVEKVRDVEEISKGDKK
ncbi:MAG: 30S ribosomal protein S17 [archaeon]